MNKTYKTKWSVAAQTWVACSELTKRAGKVAIAASLMAISTHSFALTCISAANGSYRPGFLVGNNNACNDITAATVTQSNAGWYILTASNLNGPLTIGDTTLTATSTGDYSAIGNQGAVGTPNTKNASIVAGNLNITATGNGNVTGIGTILAVPLTAKNVSLTLKDNYTLGTNNSGGVAQYGVLTGSTVNSGENSTYNGYYSTVTTDNLTINQTATGGSINPILNNGIRAIQGAYGTLDTATTVGTQGRGSTGQVIVNGTLDMTLTGNRSVGIYVSGNKTNYGAASALGTSGQFTPKVILNGDSNIVINKGTGTSFTTWDSHGVKLGKVRYAGEGAGILESHGALSIDTTNALQGGGIKMMRNSLLDASDAAASTTIKTNGYALEIGGHDDAARNGFTLTFEQAASHGMTANFNNAVFTTKGTSTDPLITTTGARKDLIFVDQGQSGVALNFTGAKTDLTANPNGYILNVSGNYTAPNYVYYSGTYDATGVERLGQELFEGSSVTLNATDAGSMTGLVYKGLVKSSQTKTTVTTPKLNLNLSNGFTWNLNTNAGAQNGDTKTALFDTTNITSGAVINGAYDNAGGNNYILIGNVNSNAGIINLDNATHGKYNDVLTINGNYTGSNGAQVKMNTLWNAPGDAAITEAEGGADSQSDVLHITGTASGATIVNPIASDGTASVIDGSVQQIASVINTVPVVIVDGANDAGTFTGTAQTTGATQVQLTSRIVANGSREYYWTMAAKETIYNPTVPSYVQMPRVNMELGYATLGTLHERRGENQTLSWDECGTCGADAKSQTWGRILGKHLEQDGKARLNMDTDMYGFQIGHDFKVKRTDKLSHLLTGVYLAYGNANTGFSDRYRAENGIISTDKYTGKGKTTGLSLGLTHTRYAANGSYLDLVGQFSYLRNKYESRDGYNVSQNGYGAALSVEAGRPYAITKHTSHEAGWMLEPQAQLIYQYVNLKDFNDGVRQVNQNGQHGLRGRLGVRLAYNAQTSEKKNYQTNTFYAVANVWHDFINPKAVSIGKDNVRETYASTWGEVGLGVQVPINDHSYVYADARYERDLGGSSKRQGYRGTIGLKYTWK